MTFTTLADPTPSWMTEPRMRHTSGASQGQHDEHWPRQPEFCCLPVQQMGSTAISKQCHLAICKMCSGSSRLPPVNHSPRAPIPMPLKKAARAGTPERAPAGARPATVFSGIWPRTASSIGPPKNSFYPPGCRRYTESLYSRFRPRRDKWTPSRPT